MTDSSHDGHDHGDHDHGDHDHGGLTKYAAVFAALCVLTTASFFTYSSYWPFQDTPAVGWAFMMAVSCTKAALVMLFFMHLWWEANWKFVLTFPAMFMAVFLMCMLIPDVGLRTEKYSEERWEYAAEPSDASDHDDGHGEDADHGAADH